LQAKEIVERTFESLDTDGSGKVEFTEFVVACMEKEKMLTKDKIDKAFQLIDEVTSKN
jgi:calcium-dependent protein kinase